MQEHRHRAISSGNLNVEITLEAASSGLSFHQLEKLLDVAKRYSRLKSNIWLVSLVCKIYPPPPSIIKSIFQKFPTTTKLLIHYIFCFVLSFFTRSLKPQKNDCFHVDEEFIKYSEEFIKYSEDPKSEHVQFTHFRQF